MTSKLEQSIKIFIEQAVARTRITAANAPKDAYKATEKRLYAYPVLRERIADIVHIFISAPFSLCDR